MNKYEKGDIVYHRPNHKVDPWKCKVVELPPVESITGRKLDRYAVEIIAPESSAGEIVNLRKSELKQSRDMV